MASTGTFGVTIRATDQASAVISTINKNLAKLRQIGVADPGQAASKSVENGMQGITRATEKMVDALKFALPASVSFFETLEAKVAKFGIAGMVLAGTLAVIGAAWKPITFAHELEIASRQVGISVEQLQRLRYAAELAGGSSDDLVKSMKSVAQTRLDAYTGGNNQAYIMYKAAAITEKDTEQEAIRKGLNYTERMQPAFRDRWRQTMGIPETAYSSQTRAEREQIDKRAAAEPVITDKETKVGEPARMAVLAGIQTKVTESYKLLLAGVEKFTDLFMKGSKLWDEAVPPVVKDAVIKVEQATITIANQQDAEASRGATTATLPGPSAEQGDFWQSPMWEWMSKKGAFVGEAIWGPKAPAPPTVPNVTKGGPRADVNPDPAKLEPITADGHKAFVSKEFAPDAQKVLDIMHKYKYPVVSLGGFAQSGHIENSKHYHGNAFDVNPSTNPQGDTLVTDMPKPMIEEIEKTIPTVKWGGRFKRHPDAMHFELREPSDPDYRPGKQSMGQTLPDYPWTVGKQSMADREPKPDYKPLMVGQRPTLPPMAGRDGKITVHVTGTSIPGTSVVVRSSGEAFGSPATGRSSLAGSV